MEDVFDITGRPPKGWMPRSSPTARAGTTWGRCIPGPPAPQPLSDQEGEILERMPLERRAALLRKWGL